MKQFYTFGQAYGEGAYGAGTYSCTTQQQAQGLCDTTAGGGTGTGGGTGSGSGSLVDTGVAIAFAVTLACLLIFVTLVVRMIRRRPRVATQEAAVEQPRRNDDNSFRS